MNGHSVRTAAQADRASRDLHRIADDLDALGLQAQASLLRSTAAQLGSLAAECARDPDAVTATRIAEGTALALLATGQCSAELRAAALPQLADDVDRVSMVLRSLNRDSQPGTA